MVACDPATELCPDAEVKPEEPKTPLTEFEDYESFTLFIGISLSVFAYAPMFIFLYPTWYGTTAEHRAILIDKHIVYFAAWTTTAMLNLIMFGPWQICWTILFFFSAPPYEGLTLGLYIFLLETLIDGYIIWTSIFTELLWIAAIALEWGKDDEAFLVIYPIIFLILYTLYTPFNVALVLYDSYKALKYFDNDFNAAKDAWIANGSIVPVEGEEPAPPAGEADIAAEAAV